MSSRVCRFCNKEVPLIKGRRECAPCNRNYQKELREKKKEKTAPKTTPIPTHHYPPPYHQYPYPQYPYPQYPYPTPTQHFEHPINGPKIFTKDGIEDLETHQLRISELEELVIRNGIADIEFLRQSMGMDDEEIEEYLDEMKKKNTKQVEDEEEQKEREIYFKESIVRETIEALTDQNGLLSKMVSQVIQKSTRVKTLEEENDTLRKLVENLTTRLEALETTRPRSTRLQSTRPQPTRPRTTPTRPRTTPTRPQRFPQQNIEETLEIDELQ